jgi:adenosylmethionine-8-amino-7-oxononanoate aminotransferase
LRNSYHGETVGALAVTDIPLFKSTYAELLRPGAHVATPDARLAESGESAEAYAHRCADELEAHFAQHADTLAAFIVEPLVQGAAGMAMYHPAYLARVRELCTRFEVHYIADEIAVGFGRTGTMFAFEQAQPFQVAQAEPFQAAQAVPHAAAPPRLTPDASRLTALPPPDFLCLSKGITGGYLPLAAVLTTDTVYAAFLDDATARGFLHSHSYTGNPLACRAALAVLDIFESDDTLAANAVKAHAFSALLAPLARHPRVRHFRHTGMIWAFDVVDAAPGFAADFHQKLLAHGVFLRPIGHTVYLMPPYISTAEDIAHVAAALLACLA